MRQLSKSIFKFSLVDSKNLTAEGYAIDDGGLGANVLDYLSRWDGYVVRISLFQVRAHRYDNHRIPEFMLLRDITIHGRLPSCSRPAFEAMHMRRFTRLTNGFSKKIDNHAYAVALHFMYCNFVRIHQTLRVTPAMEAGLCDHAWTIEDLIEMVNVAMPKPAKRGPYQKKISN